MKHVSAAGAKRALTDEELVWLKAQSWAPGSYVPHLLETIRQLHAEDARRLAESAQP